MKWNVSMSIKVVLIIILIVLSLFIKYKMNNLPVS
jgi:hypothetical protein